MDPNETLKQLRDTFTDFADRDVATIYDVDRISELFEALDTWLSRGGFLPDDWAHIK